jgi:hypothetical protein
MPVKLDYQDIRTIIRHRRRVLICGVILVLSTVISIWKGGRIVVAIRFQYYQWRCLRFTESNTTVAYDSDDKAMAALSAGDNAYRHDDYGYGYQPDSLATLIALRFTPWCPGIIFMHERVSRGGNRRLVWVERPGGQFSFRRAAWIPESLFGTTRNRSLSKLTELINSGTASPLEDDGPNDYPGSMTSKWKRDRTLKAAMKIFFGQPDPEDASHFTIRYEIDGVPGIIDGWLGDDDAVRMQANGPWAVPPGTYGYGNNHDIMRP